jgi:dTDP-4-dehydrorhamnose 3,5-epimerase
LAAFEFRDAGLPGALISEAFSAGDYRGGFSKTFEKDLCAAGGLEFDVAETFISTSSAGVMRGLHFQLARPQAKLVTVIRGRAWDCIVDLRPQSPTYTKWVSFELSDENHRILYVPRGFAHGFASLEDGTMMLYHCEGAYDRDSDSGVRLDDPDLGIKWPFDLSEAIRSRRDLELPTLREYKAHPMELG